MTLSSGYKRKMSSFASDQTLYYDDVKLANQKLSLLSKYESTSCSSIKSKCNDEFRLKSLNKRGSTQSELELFRKRAEMNSMKNPRSRKEALVQPQAIQKKALLEASTSNAACSSNSEDRKTSEQSNSCSIPHWHETLKKQSVILTAARQLKTQQSLEAVISPEVQVTTPSGSNIFTLVKPRILPSPGDITTDKLSHLSPTCSCDNSHSSQESISVYIKAAQSSELGETPAGGNQKTPAMASHLTCGTTKEQKSIWKTLRDSLSKSDRGLKDSVDTSQKKSKLEKVVSELNKIPVNAGSSKNSASLSNVKSHTAPIQKLRRAALYASLPKNWMRNKGICIMMPETCIENISSICLKYTHVSKLL